MDKFLHNHPEAENIIANSGKEGEKAYFRNHVIVDKKDWIEAIGILDSLKGSTREPFLQVGDTSYDNLSRLMAKENASDIGIKYDSDKPRFDLIPADALEEVAKVYTVGANKYGDRNWEKGLSYGKLFGAMLRHSWAWWRGEKDDQENKLHHLSSVVFCALGLLHYELDSGKFSKFDDRNK